jgi:hypothetical protein
MPKKTCKPTITYPAKPQPANNTERIKDIQRRIGTPDDGAFGPKSRAALRAHLQSLAPKVDFPRDRDDELIAYYGRPGQVEMTQLIPPYEMYLFGDRRRVVNVIGVHVKLGVSLAAIMADLLRAYPTPESRAAAGVDAYYGIYNDRTRTAGGRKSIHAWAAAIDFDAANNKFADPWPQKAKMPLTVLEIFASHGWKPLAATINKDAMHFEATAW